MAILPAEVILLILRYVGVQKLRKTLATSKSWFQYAAPIVCEQVTVRLSGRIPCQLERHAGARYRRITEDSLRDFTMLTPPFTFTDRDTLTDPEDIRCRFKWLWKDILPVFKRITTLHVSEAPPRLTHELQEAPTNFSMTESPIAFSQVAGFLRTLDGMQSLSSIHIDMTSPRLVIGRHSRSEDDMNLCSIFARLMGRLDHVELRMPYICPDIFSLYETQSTRSEHHPGPRTIIINCSISSKDPHLTRKSHSCDCKAWQSGVRVPVSIESMLDAARLCLPKLTRIQRLRVVRHVLPVMDTVAHDVVDGCNYEVSEKDWTEVGKLIEEKGDEEESLFSSEELIEARGDPII